MKRKQNRAGKELKRKGIRLRVAQKTSIRKVVIASSIFGVLAASFIYFNFFNNSASHAETVQPSYRPTYTTVDVDVPVRLLIKPDANARAMVNSNYKTDTSFTAKKLSRGQAISAEQYMAD